MRRDRARVDLDPEMGCGLGFLSESNEALVGVAGRGRLGAAGVRRHIAGRYLPTVWVSGDGTTRADVNSS